MKRITSLLILTLLFCVAVPAQEDAGETFIRPGSKVYIHPMDGFETYISAAMDKKKVPLLIVADREKADFEIKGTAEMQKAGWSKTIFGSGRPAVNASIQVINIKSSVVAYSVASHKDNAWSGMKSAAEHIAKNLAKKIREDVKK